MLFLSDVISIVIIRFVVVTGSNLPYPNMSSQGNEINLDEPVVHIHCSYQLRSDVCVPHFFRRQPHQLTIAVEAGVRIEIQTCIYSITCILEKSRCARYMFVIRRGIVVGEEIFEKKKLISGVSSLSARLQSHRLYPQLVDQSG